MGNSMWPLRQGKAYLLNHCNKVRSLFKGRNEGLCCLCLPPALKLKRPGQGHSSEMTSLPQLVHKPKHL